MGPPLYLVVGPMTILSVHSMPNRTGYIELRTLQRGESRWFWSAGSEHRVWFLHAHGFGMFFCIIGPFRRKYPEPGHRGHDGAMFI